jgi:hypothetical protein
VPRSKRGRPILPRYICGYPSAARYLGLGSKHALRAWVKKFDIPVRVINNRSYFDRYELERVMDPDLNQTTETKDNE